jgi:pimeloyl-ACP methyl ester carboxylesterase
VLKEFVESLDLDPYRRTDGRQMVTAAMRKIERYTPSDTAREDYLSSYEGDRFAESMRYVRTFPTDLPVLCKLLPNIRTPVLIIAGRQDPIVPLDQRGVPPRKAAPEQACCPRHWALHVGGRADDYTALVTAGGTEATRSSETKLR